MLPAQVTRFTGEARRVFSLAEPTSPAQAWAFLGFFVAFIGTMMTSGRGQTLIAVLWLGGALAFGLTQGARALFVRAPRARARANAYRDNERADGSDSADRRALEPGHVVLRGEVAFAQGADGALQVEIVEAGREWTHKASTKHEWVEERRTVTACPFYLVRPGGQRIRVEPTTTVTLPYRELARPTGLVLRGAPTLLVSSVSLAHHFRARAWLHTVQGVVALLFLVAPTLMAGRILDRALGSTEAGVVDSSYPVYSGKRPVLVGYAAGVVVDGVRWKSEPLAQALEKGTPYVMRVGRYSAILPS